MNGQLFEVAANICINALRCGDLKANLTKNKLNFKFITMNANKNPMPQCDKTAIISRFSFGVGFN